MKTKAVNEEEVVRVPIAFAMVKLMQTLPQEVMEVNLPRYEKISLFAGHAELLGPNQSCICCFRLAEYFIVQRL